VKEKFVKKSYGFSRIFYMLFFLTNKLNATDSCDQKNRITPYGPQSALISELTKYATENPEGIENVLDALTINYSMPFEQKLFVDAFLIIIGNEAQTRVKADRKSCLNFLAHGFTAVTYHFSLEDIACFLKQADENFYNSSLEEAESYLINFSKPAILYRPVRKQEPDERSPLIAALAAKINFNRLSARKMVALAALMPVKATVQSENECTDLHNKEIADYLSKNAIRHVKPALRKGLPYLKIAALEMTVVKVVDFCDGNLPSAFKIACVPTSLPKNTTK
jgi:hypothetical protein